MIISTNKTCRIDFGNIIADALIIFSLFNIQSYRFTITRYLNFFIIFEYHNIQVSFKYLLRVHISSMKSCILEVYQRIPTKN